MISHQLLFLCWSLQEAQTGNNKASSQMYGPSCSLRVCDDFFDESPQRESSEIFLNKKHPHRNAKQAAKNPEHHATSVSSP